MEVFDYDLDRYYEDLDKVNDCELCGEACEDELCTECSQDNKENI
jgi:hypothetical protein